MNNPAAKRAAARLLSEPVLTLAISLLFLVLAFFDCFLEYELKAYDLLSRLKDTPKALPVITHVDIDDKSISLLGKWPWPRDRHASLIRILNECGAKVIALDILFIEKGKQLPKSEGHKNRLSALLQELQKDLPPEPNPPPPGLSDKVKQIRTLVQEEIVDEDEELAEALRQSKAEIFLPAYIPSDEKSAAEFFKGLRASDSKEADAFLKKISAQVKTKGEPLLPFSQNILPPVDRLLPFLSGGGHVNNEPDVDGAMRRASLLWRVGDSFYPQMFLAAALGYMGISDPVFELSENRLSIHSNHPKNSPEAEGIEIPVTNRGEMLIHWAGKWNTDFPHIPYSTVLAVEQVRREKDDLYFLLDQKYGQGGMARIRDDLLIRKSESPAAEATAIGADPFAFAQGLQKAWRSAAGKSPAAGTLELEAGLEQAKKNLFAFLEKNLTRGLEKYQNQPSPVSLQELSGEINLLKDLAAREEYLKKHLTAFIENRICIIGLTATGTHDIKPIPLQAAYPMVGMNSNLMNNILSKNFIRRASRFLNILLMLLSGAVICFLTLSHHNWRSAFFALLYMTAYALASFHCLNRLGLWINVVNPLACSGLIFIVNTVVRYTKQELEKRWIKNAFQSYLSEDVVEELIRNPEKLKLGGEMKNMTLLFADIRGFTTISEQFNAHELTQFINRFLTPMTDIILKRRGTIDKYMGDCIMAFWNAPLNDDDHARHACLAALDMQNHLARWNQELEAEAQAAGKKFIPIHIGVGLNTGNCCVGNMGSNQRFDYSVLGDDVNLASRLEGQSKTYGVDIVLGQNTFAMARDFASLELDLIRVKGKNVPVRIFALLGLSSFRESAEFQVLNQTHGEMLAAYRTQDWKTARLSAEKCLALETGKTKLQPLYRLYMERISKCEAHPPEKDWDGVFTATTK